MNRSGDLPTAQHTTAEEPPTSLFPAPPQRRHELLRIALSRPVVLLALRMSLLIGTLLNLINQGDALLGAAPLVPGKLLLTYMVPYCVATYSATSVTLRLRGRD